MSKSVGEDFRQRWNTTRSMADVWGEEAAERKRVLQRVAERERGARFVAEYQRRHSNLPNFTPAGRIAYAGYERE